MYLYKLQIIFYEILTSTISFQMIYNRYILIITIIINKRPIIQFYNKRDSLCYS